MKTKPWCLLCGCKGPNYKGESSWKCPLVDQICSTCCYHELAGGTGAPDTLENVEKLTGMTPQQIHATCRKCKHGGKHLGESAGSFIAEPGHEKEILEAEKYDLERLKWLRGIRKTKP